MELQCPICQIIHHKTTGHYNRAIKQGLKLYCSKECAGIGRRHSKTSEQLKADKAEYDRKYREREAEKLKQRKSDYYQRTKDPVKEAILRKKYKHAHAEYIKQPKYREWKKSYDEMYLAKQRYGEFAEAFLIAKKIFDLLDNRAIKQINNLHDKSIKRKRSWSLRHKKSLPQLP